MLVVTHSTPSAGVVEVAAVDVESDSIGEGPEEDILVESDFARVC